MVHALFDTNIYGKIIIDTDELDVIASIVSSRLIVHNFALIRDELRNTAKSKTHGGGQKVRISLLRAYDQITTQRVIPVSNEISVLAEAFYEEYKHLGGTVAKKRILSDFKIVACPTLKGFDVVVSDDNKTMRGAKAMSAYHSVALAHNLRAPGFMSYAELKRGLTGSLQ